MADWRWCHNVHVGYVLYRALVRQDWRTDAIHVHIGRWGIIHMHVQVESAKLQQVELRVENVTKSKGWPDRYVEERRGEWQGRYIHIENGEREEEVRRGERERGREGERTPCRKRSQLIHIIFMLNLENCCMYMYVYLHNVSHAQSLLPCMCMHAQQRVKVGSARSCIVLILQSVKIYNQADDKKLL